MITSIRGSIHQGHEAFSEHSRGRQCAFMSLAALLFNRSNRPFPSSCLPPLQSEFKCEVFVMKISFQVKL